MAHLDISYVNAVRRHSKNWAWAEDGTCLGFNWVATRTCWYAVAEALVAAGRPMTKREIVKATRAMGVYAADCPDEFATFGHDRFLKKTRQGRTFVYELTEGGYKNFVACQRTFAADMRKAQEICDKRPKTKDEALQAYARLAADKKITQLKKEAAILK